jgi:hypothetical protein
MIGDYSQQAWYRNFFNNPENAELTRKLKNAYKFRSDTRNPEKQTNEQEYQLMLYEAYIRLYAIFQEQNITNHINRELFQ